MSSWFGWLASSIGAFLDFLGLRDKKGKLLLLGLDNAGKTTLLGLLTQGVVAAHRPTYNPNVEDCQMGGLTLKLIDMGGHEDARRLWRDYMCGLSGIVFLVDAASSTVRMEEAKAELHKILADDEVARVPVLVMGNKIDLPSARPEQALAEQLGLEGLRTGKSGKGLDGRAATAPRPLEVFMCSVVKKVGYADGFRWLGAHMGA